MGVLRRVDRRLFEWNVSECGVVPQALDGLGKPTSLYMYPYEGHGPAARETILDLWGRWCMWLDKYVKRAEQKAEENKTTKIIELQKLLELSIYGAQGLLKPEENGDLDEK